MLVRERLRQFIKDSFLVDDFRDDDSFLGTGIIDSLGMMQLVAFIESEFRISVADADLLPENFDTLERLTAYVDRMRRAA